MIDTSLKCKQGFLNIVLVIIYICNLMQQTPLILIVRESLGVDHLIFCGGGGRGLICKKTNSLKRGLKNNLA